MSPIDENELRDELWFAEPASSPVPDALGATVISRGRAVRRRRIAAASAATVAVVALAGAGIWNVLPRDDQHAVPAQTPSAPATVDPTPSSQPSPSASPSATAGPTPSASGTPRPSAAPTARPTPGRTPGGSPAPSVRAPWPNDGSIPGSYGDIGTYELMLTGPGYELATGAIALCPDPGVRYAAMADLEAGRTVGWTGEGEGGDGESILVFRTEEAARAFMQQLRSGAAACQALPLPETNPEGYPRTLHTSQEYDAGDEGYLIASHDELYRDGRWGEVPGAVFQMWVRSGRAVLLGGSGGEYVGDVITNRPDVIADMRAIIDHGLPQTCQWTEAGC